MSRLFFGHTHITLSLSVSVSLCLCCVVAVCVCVRVRRVLCMLWLLRLLCVSALEFICAFDGDELDFEDEHLVGT